jgi:HNH endonuclease
MNRNDRKSIESPYAATIEVNSSQPQPPDGNEIVRRTILQPPINWFPRKAQRMSESVSQKRPRIRKAPVLYARLRREILERDGWRCQGCGCSTNLDVHHMRRCSALGDDVETNLIALFRECHRILHGFSSSPIRRGRL